MSEIGKLLLGEFAKNPADWLSFLTTAILGAVTVYFAARTRALERQQVRQINREFDRELLEAEAELNGGASLRWYWEHWGGNGDLRATLAIYARARQGMTAPDLVKVQRILAFHLPAVEDRAGKAIIRLTAALAALDAAFQSSGGALDTNLAKTAAKFGDTVAETSAELESVLEAVRNRRKELRA